MNPWMYLPVVLGSFLLSALLVHLSINLALRVGSVDRPDGDRKTQARPIPRLGGVAVVVAFSVTLLLVSLVTGQSNALPLLAGVLVPALLMAGLGFLDDRKPTNPWLRLGAQTAIALLAWALGTRVSLFSWEVLNVLIVVLWITAIVNAINMLDNSDGLAASTTIVIAVGSALIAMLLGQYLVAALAWSLVGVAAGFLWHNWHPAKVYLGDAGSYFLGFMLAVVAIRLKPITITSGWSALVPILLLSLPLIDLAFVVLRRASRGIHPFTAGRDHLSHSLQALGRSVPHSVGILMGSAALGCGAAVAIVAIGP